MSDLQRKQRASRPATKLVTKTRDLRCQQTAHLILETTSGKNPVEDNGVESIQNKPTQVRVWYR